VDEFASRIFEEMDFKNEAKNIRRFDALYGPNGTSRHALPPPGFVRVPALYPEFPATRRVLIMEWLDGQRVMSLVSPNQKFKQQKERKDRAGLSGDVEACEIVVGEDPWCEAEEEERERAEEKAELARKAASLPLIDLGIRCTLSQLIETGVMHADPHGGNLLRLDGSGDLAYLDFGLVSEVPPTVRDALVAAVTLLVFSRDYEAVAGLFGELMLVPADVIESEYQFAELTNALKEAAEATLIFPSDVKAAIVGNEEAKGAAVADKAAAAGGGAEGSDFVGHMSAWPRAAETGGEAGGEAGYSADEATEEPAKTKGEQKSEKREALLRERGRGIAAVPDVRFDQLLGALLALVPRFRFVLPPYFLNNARALGTLEGMARSADPSFNILAVVYPFAVKRLLANPSGSPVLRRVLRRLVSDEKTGALSLTRLRDMVDDAAALTGVPRDKIIKVGLHKLNPVVTHSLKPPGFIQPFSL
jgi:predicted unusual protein kinase regulating ubiquinone biosynthesis (AarF/ABC1/UbiB family)